MLKKIDPIERILLKRNTLSSKVLDEVKANHPSQGRFLGKTLVEHGYIHAEVLLKTLSQEMKIPFVKFKDFLVF